MSEGQRGRNHSHVDEDEHTEIEVPPTPFEWIARAVAFVLVGIVVAVLGWYAFAGDDPEAFRVTAMLDDVEERGATFLLPVEITNTGGDSVSELSITVELVDGDMTLESEDVTLAQLAHGQTTMFVAAFDRDPRSVEVAVDIGSYLIE